MKIRILGTAAAEAWPAIFCNCDTCKKVREVKGKNIRSRSSILIDETLMIDGSFDNFMHSLQNGVDFRKIKNVFFTHNHTDHFLKNDYLDAFTSDLCIYGNEDVINSLLTYKDKPEVYTGINVINPYETVKTNDNHVVSTVKAEHSPDLTNQLNYIIKGDKTIAYLTDSGLYRDEKTWDYLKDFKFDAVISECTCGWLDFEPYYHQTFAGVLKARERFISMGCINENTPYYITHFSHNAKLLYEEMVEKAKPYNIEVCYDGMDIII